jgi:glycosyltransferase involved in cell wall biosynthesis
VTAAAAGSPPGEAVSVTCVISSLRAGGSERVMAELVNHWARRGWAPTLVLLAPAGEAFYRLEPGVGVQALGLERRSHGVAAGALANLRRVVALRRALRRGRGRAVLSFVDQTNVLVLLAAVGLRRRVAISIRTDPRRRDDLSRVWRALRAALYRRADAVVVQTDEVRRWAERIVSPARVTVIPNPTPPARPAADRGRGRPVVLSVGRLSEVKGHDLLVRAFARCGTAAGWSLVVVGDGEQRGRLLALGRELGVDGRLHLPGQVAELDDFLSDAAVYASASRVEGFPNALVEAMASGLPVVATATAGARAIVRHGVDGLLVEVDDEPALAAALARLMSDAELRQRLAERAREVTRRFPREAILGKWDSLMQTLSAEA